MNSSQVITEAIDTEAVGTSGSLRPAPLSPWALAMYLVCLVASMLLWLRPIGSALWLDETFSYWQTRGGFWDIAGRSAGWPCSPVYPYILWIFEKIGGTSEIALRVPSVLATAAAAYFLFRAGKELFGREPALVAAIFFSLYPSVMFSAVDARAYAFALLLTNIATFLLVRWVKNQDIRYAVLFGAACAGVLYFQYLYAVLFPVFLVYYLWERRRELSSALRQAVAALAAFAVLMAPLVPHVLSVMRARDTHSFAAAPQNDQIYSHLVPAGLSTVIIWTILGALVFSRVGREKGIRAGAAAFSVGFAIFPTLVLFNISMTSSMQVFIDRYLLVCVPGIALSWAWLLSFVNSRVLRQAATVAMVAVAAVAVFQSNGRDKYTWKPAIEKVRNNIATDHAPVLVCSDFVESNTHSLPSGPVDDSAFVSQFSYYKLGTPVTVLPRDFNDSSPTIINAFVRNTLEKRQRFIVMAYAHSNSTIGWIARQTTATHTAHPIGSFDNVIVVEFVPR